MTEEQIKQKFKETYPDFMRGDEPLSPYFDIWEYAIEIATEELREENKQAKELQMPCNSCLLPLPQTLIDKNKELQAENERLANKILDDWCRNKDDYCPHLKKLEKQNKKMINCYNCEYGQNESYCPIKHSDICDLSCWDEGCEDWRLRK